MNGGRQLTNQQAELLDLIRNFIKVSNYSPTYREIGELMGWKSKSHVAYHLKALREAGYIRLTPGRARTIRVITETLSDEA